MRKILFFAVVGLTSLLTTSRASAESHEPTTMRNVILVYDLMKENFNPTPHLLSLGVAAELPTDPSCRKIRVHYTDEVFCVSQNNQETKVGALGQTKGSKGYHVYIGVDWLDNVELITPAAHGPGATVRVKRP